MAPSTSSLVWKYFEKNGNKSAKCKLCEKNIRTAGNTSNLMGHIKHIHKATFLEMAEIKNSGTQKLINTNFVRVLGENTPVVSDSCVPSTSSSHSVQPVSCIEVNDDTTTELVPLKRQRSIQTSFEDIASYSDGDKAKKINNAIVYMICKDYHAFSLVENEGFKHLIKVLSPHFKVPCRGTVTRWVYNNIWKKKHIPCFAHSLNLAQKVLNISELQALVTKIKNIVTFFKQSCVASDELRKTTKADAKLIQDVPSRWNSTFYMIERFLELRNAVSDILLRHKTAPPMLTGMELSTSSKLLNILRPFEAATKEISGDTYCNSSKVIPLVHCMVSKLKALEIEEPLLNEVHKMALIEINKRMGDIEHVSLLAIATLLDPRFKKIHFEDPLACSKAVGKIQEMIRDMADEKSGDGDSDISDNPIDEFSLWSDHHKLVHRNWKTNRTEGNFSDELSVYLRSPVSRFDENPLEVWADYKIQFPSLYNIAYKYLTMVASSVPSERLFSKASLVLSQKRSSLQAERVNKILFL
ncbi:E3 SUMO-protein ligase ZBED1-like [Lucilia sericata]|uniref:E3 SUMO-protein ligase ZBED1-like n=1 Tax=Lucilia sericata TaxID=13632 RepID=UPI0018A848C0|nr:E3 SUMO-protein ligase ZBED1-like [Lucilia sericata]